MPDDWVYVYSKTGEEGAHIWAEIARNELPRARVIVVFWSKNYIASDGCVRELKQAHDLVKSGQLRALILRLDDFPIVWSDEIDKNLLPIFESLQIMLDYRTSAPHVTVERATDLVQRVVEPILGSDHPQLPRHDLLEALRTVSKKDRYTYYPAVWISGFNGVGRETLTKEFNRAFVPNGRGIVIDVNEASLPKQVLLRIESEAFGADHNRLLRLNASLVDDPATVAEAIDRVATSGNYIILRHSRIVEENVDLPDWLDDTVRLLNPTTRPKLFIISQLPLLGERRTHARESLVSQRVPTVDEHQATEFCYQLIGHFDKNPNRWSDRDVENVVRASGGTIGFLLSLVRAAAGINGFDQIDQLVTLDSQNMAASITIYVRWAFSQLRDFEDEQRALLFLSDISPCDIADIERAVSPKRPILRVLGKLLELGLIEREEESVYRLTPLLARRLDRDLIRPDLLAWQRRSLAALARKPIEIESSDREYLRIESRIQASLLAETEDIPAGVVDFISAAHWFQAGIRLYHARRREPAYRMLKKAHAKRLEFASAGRTELTRYYCLSATRNRKYEEAERCIILLDGAHQTKGMAAFLRADLLEHQRKYIEAISQYESSIELNKGMNNRIERAYRPLIRCILSSPNPDFQLAERYAKKWLHLRQTVFGLMALARVYLRWKYRGRLHGRAVPRDIDALYQSALADLEAQPGVGSAHFELKAEEAEFSGRFGDALEYMNQAILAHPRFELRTERWRLMANCRIPEMSYQVLKELNAAKNSREYKANWLPFLPQLAETFAIALKNTGQALGAVNTFAPELPGQEISPIVARVKQF